MRKSILTVILLSVVSLVYAQDPGVRDTCWVEKLASAPASSQVVVTVYLVNDENVGGFTVPLAFPDSVTHYDITCDSISFVDTRGATAAYKSDSTSVDNINNKLNIFALYFPPFILEPGNTPIAKIYFTTGPTWNPSLSVPIDTTTWQGSGYEFSTEGGNPFFPVFWKGALDVGDEKTSTKPKVYSLSQNYPNPFNPITILRFGLPRDSWVKLEVYNVLGQKVKTLVNENLTAGMQEKEWDGTDENGFEVASGIYFYKIQAESFSDIKKMVLLK